MACSLCLDTENDEQLIAIGGDEAQRLNIAYILHLHLRFFFQVKIRIPELIGRS